MPKAIEKRPSGLTVGHAALGLQGGVPGSIRQQVHDGDTINVRAIGNFGVRFLGVDAPEMLPDETLDVLAAFARYAGAHEGQDVRDALDHPTLAVPVHDLLRPPPVGLPPFGAGNARARLV